MSKQEIQKYYEFLKENDYIKPGNIIEVEILKDLFGCRDIDSMDYIGPMILLEKEILNKSGYFCRSVDKSIYVCSDDEKAYIAKKMREKSDRITKEAIHGLIKTDPSNISDQETRNQHQHQLNILLMLNRKTKLILDEMGEI